jgi:hypothetical protein
MPQQNSDVRPNGRLRYGRGFAIGMPDWSDGRGHRNPWTKEAEEELRRRAQQRQFPPEIARR